MRKVAETINQTIDELKESLREYIESTYHVSEPKLVEQRRILLEQLGVIHQRPFLESTPRYAPGRKFANIPGLAPNVIDLLTKLASPDDSGKTVLFDPPYKHQAEAIQQA